MSFLSGFAGTAAQAYDESLKGWKALFQDSERLQENKRQFDTELEYRRERAAKDDSFRVEEFDWKKDLEDKRLNFDINRDNNQQMTEFYDRAQLILPELSPTDRIELANQFDSLYGQTTVGRGLSTALQSTVSSAEYLSPNQARAGVTAILNRPLGEATSAGMLQDFLSALGDSPHDDDLRQMAEIWMAGNAEAWAEEQERLGVLNAQEVERGQAEIRAVGASADVDVARAAQIIQDTGLDLERWTQGEQVLLQNAVTLSNLEVDRAEVDAELYPETAALALRNLAAEVGTREGGLEILNRTIDAQVEEIINNMVRSGVALDSEREDLRFKLKTAGMREAILGEDLNTARAYIRNLNTQTELTAANVEQAGVDLESSRWNLEQARIDFVSAIAESGSVEMAGLLGEDLLRPMFGDNWQDVASDLTDRALSQRDAADRRVTAAIIVEEWNADNIERVYADGRADEDFDRRMAERAAAVAEGNLAVNRGHLKVAQDQAQLAWKRLNAPANPANWNEAASAANSASGVNRDELVQRVGASSGIRTDASNLRTLAEGFTGAPEQLAMLEGIKPTLDEYGIDVEMLTDPGSFALVAELLDREAMNLETDFIRSGTLWFSAMTKEGHVPAPNDFGLDLEKPGDRDIWDAIAGSTPEGQFVEREGEAAWNEIAPFFGNILNANIPHFVANGNIIASAGGAEIVFDQMVDAVGVEALANAGFESADDILPQIIQSSEEYVNLTQTIEGHGALLTTYGLPYDINYQNRDEVSSAAATVSAHIDQMNGILNPETGILRDIEPLSPGAAHLVGPGPLTHHKVAIEAVLESSNLTLEYLTEMGYIGSVQTPASDQDLTLFRDPDARSHVIIDPAGLRQLLSTQRESSRALANALTGLSARY